MKQLKKETRKVFYIAASMLAAFVLWTLAISYFDVQPIGPQGSTVGFATINKFVHNLTGVHMSLYIVTDWLGLVPLCFGLGFALLGLVQWIKRGHILTVDYSILVLGGFYILVMLAYILFEMFVVNYRPILINGYLEASYPSSTTILVICMMTTAIMQFHHRIKNQIVKRCVTYAITVFIVFMVVCRLISGVHWLTDIIGGFLLSSGLVSLYCAVSNLKIK